MNAVNASREMLKQGEVDAISNLRAADKLIASEFHLAYHQRVEEHLAWLYKSQRSVVEGTETSRIKPVLRRISGCR